MKNLAIPLVALALAACTNYDPTDDSGHPKTAAAQVGIVNHTGNYIYSAGITGIGWRGGGGGGMDRWGAGGANICCASIPWVWKPGMQGIVRWDMPDGHTHNIKEQVVEVEKYDEPGDVYLHFFPNDEIRVIVTNVAGWSLKHPVPPSKPPAEKR